MKSVKIIAVCSILMSVLISCGISHEAGRLNDESSAANAGLTQSLERPAEQTGKFDGITGDQTTMLWHIKDVPVDVSDADLDKIEELGFQVLVPGWGVGSAEITAVKALLNRLAERQLKIVLDGGFSSGALGFEDDGSDPVDQRPVWQKEAVSVWINALKNYPAVYGWDISNEAGENVPNGDRFRVSLDQLKNISATVRELDPQHPILIRMHHWREDYYEDGDFGWDNPFSAGLADIVMLNLYSNYSEDGEAPLIPNMVADDGQVLVNKVLAVDPKVKIWLSLAMFEEEPMFTRPTAERTRQDIEDALRLESLASIGWFGWGETEGWYLPRDGSDLLPIVGEIIGN